MSGLTVGEGEVLGERAPKQALEAALAELGDRQRQQLKLCSRAQLAARTWRALPGSER